MFENGKMVIIKEKGGVHKLLQQIIVFQRIFDFNLKYFRTFIIFDHFWSFLIIP